MEWESQEARRGASNAEGVLDATNGQKGARIDASEQIEASGGPLVTRVPKVGDWIQVRHSGECPYRWCQSIGDGAYAVIISRLATLAGMIDGQTVNSDGHVWFVGYPHPDVSGTYVSAWLALEEIRPMTTDDDGRYCEDVERMRRIANTVKNISETW